MSRSSYITPLTGELKYLCDNCGTACFRYQAECAECGGPLADPVERAIGPDLDEVALKHHGMLPELCEEFEEP